MNLFDLVNEELKRLYEEREYWRDQTIRQSEGASLNFSRTQYHELNDKIKSVRDKLFTQIEGYDKKVQEIIAEKALTGSSNE